MNLIRQQWKDISRDWESQNGQWDNSATDQLFNVPFPNLMGHKIIFEGPFINNRLNLL